MTRQQATIVASVIVALSIVIAGGTLSLAIVLAGYGY